MKKLLFLFALTLALVVGNTASAQSYYSGKIADSTLTNTQTADFFKTVTGAKSNVTFQYVATNTSGTTASVITLYGTIDGTNYTLLATDSVSATSSFARSYNYNAYAKYKVTITQTGTSVTNYKVIVLYRS